MSWHDTIILAWVAAVLSSWAAAAEHSVAPGADPQAAVDRATPGDRVVLLPGLHERPLGRHQAMLFIDKPLDLELSAGATLRLAAGQTRLETIPEITTDHSAKTIDDLEMGGTYDRSRGPLLLTITIDGAAGDAAAADTFSWAVGVFGKPLAAGVPITGDWQPLAHGIELRFPNRRGHNKGAFWFVSYDGPASYGVRVGHGTQVEPIVGVRIGGRGTIDLASGANVQPSEMVRDISACVLLHGRVRDVLVEEVTLANTMRSVMVYGEHSGGFLPGGDVGPGESFDAEGIDILGTRTINPGSPGYPRGAAYLLGHPSHRGRLSRVRCNFNVMESVTTSIEPNFNLAGYEVIGNLIASGGEAVHCWRRSTDGVVVDNVRLADAARRRVVSNNAPSGWAKSERLAFSGNVNLAADPLDTFGTGEPLPPGHVILGGNTTGDERVVLVPRRGAVAALALPLSATRIRGIVVARSGDGQARAAFQFTARVVPSTTGPGLDDVVIVPAERTHDGFDAALSIVPADGSQAPALEVTVGGAAGTTLEWRCHLATGTGDPWAVIEAATRLMR
jgi:hypothetical protein